jgi:polysaccharide biosynthesis protein PslH
VDADARRHPEGVPGPVDLKGSRLSLLFLLPFAPCLRGLHGGSRVTGQLLAGLARRHDVAALYLADHDEPSPEKELLEACRLLEPVQRGRPPRGLRERLAPKLALLRGVPTWASELAEPRFASRAAELAERLRPDVLQVEYPVMGQYLPALDHCPAPRVLVDHDASVRDLRQWRWPFAPLIAPLDARAWRIFERRVIDRVQAVVVFTDRDRRALEELGARTWIVQIPLGTTLGDSPLDPIGGSPPGVLFVGNFSHHPPNTDAALWLGRSILPPLRATHPDVRLTIVGPSPTPEVQALAGNGVVVTGEVPDVTPYLADAAVVVVPIRVGGGMRVKVLEALAAGKAVVATPLAVEGLAVSAGDQLEIAETEEELRGAISRLLGDAERRRAVAARARAWALEHLGWSESIARYEALYEALMSRTTA